MASHNQYHCHHWFLQGAQSGPLWCDWAIMEQRKGDRQLCRYLFSKSLEALPRGRFTYLSWATFEQQEGQLDNAQRLLERGHRLNQREPAILQVGGRLGCLPGWGPVMMLAGGMGQALQLSFYGACHSTKVWKHDSLLASPVAQSFGVKQAAGGSPRLRGHPQASCCSWPLCRSSSSRNLVLQQCQAPDRDSAGCWLLASTGTCMCSQVHSLHTCSCTRPLQQIPA